MRNKFEILNPNAQNENLSFWEVLVSVIYSFCHWALFRISHFGFRISSAIIVLQKALSVSVLLIAAQLFSSSMALADDVGITKARLIQESEKSYLLEADTTQVLVWAIKAPIFPDRFQVSELEYVTQSGWIVVQARATTEGEPLAAQDKLLLPWMRNGVALTVQWQDGTIQQSLFLRSLEGIHVPMRLLIDTPRALAEVCVDHFRSGLEHIVFKGIHLLFVAALWLLFPARQLFVALLYYAFGQAVAMVLADLGLPGFDLLLADMMGVLVVLLTARAVVKHMPGNPYMSLAALFGLLHGLAVAQSLAGQALPLDQKIPALFMFNLAIDAGHFFWAAILVLLSEVLGHTQRWKTITATVAGALAVALLAVVFNQHVLAGKTDILLLSDTQIATRFALPAAQKSPAGGQRPRGARQLTSPVMSYLSVEPYEVRLEVLMQAREAVRFLGVDDAGMGSIPVQSLEPVKQGILKVFQTANPVIIDEQNARPVLTRADFVTLGPAGVIVRPAPVAESLDQGIIGMTLVYETPELADEIQIEWRLFSETVQKIEATSTDPFGGATMILSPDENRWQWKSRLSGYRVPVIETIAVEKKELPVVSIVLFTLVAMLVLVATLRRRSLLRRPVLPGIIGLGFALYPFVTYPLDLPWVSQWAPSNARTSVILERLLTNVYRAFDVRDENRVYDRLAVSVTGDQLSQIYLENRKALEFENRGGARANVDDVEILSINAVKRSANDGFLADAAWTISGSVSHFGHTHYRQNRYHALVTFAMAGDVWKIRGIELIDEKRIL